MAKKTHGNNTIELLPQDENGIVSDVVIIDKDINQIGTYYAVKDKATGYGKVVVDLETPTLFSCGMIWQGQGAYGTYTLAPEDYGNSLKPRRENGTFANYKVFGINDVNYVPTEEENLETYYDAYNQKWYIETDNFELEGEGEDCFLHDCLVWVYTYALPQDYHLERLLGNKAYSKKNMHESNVNIIDSGRFAYYRGTGHSSSSRKGFNSISGLGGTSGASGSNMYYVVQPNAKKFEEVADKYGNHFLKIPTTYRKVETAVDGQITAYCMLTVDVNDPNAWRPADFDQYEVYPCFIDHTDNDKILPYILVGKYQLGWTNNVPDDKGYSKSVKELYMDSWRSYNSYDKPTNLRNRCKACGTGYFAYDWQVQRLLIDFARCWSMKPYLTTDPAVSYYTIMGFVVSRATRGTLVDGVVRRYNSDNSKNDWWICYDESKYISISSNNPTEAELSDYTRVGYQLNSGVNGSTIESVKGVTKLGYDLDNPFFNYPQELSDDGYTTNDYHSEISMFRAGSMVTQNITSAYNANADQHIGYHSLLTNIQVTSSNYGNVCSRLCYKPIKDADGYVEVEAK